MRYINRRKCPKFILMIRQGHHEIRDPRTDMAVVIDLYVILELRRRDGGLFGDFKGPESKAHRDGKVNVC